MAYEDSFQSDGGGGEYESQNGIGPGDSAAGRATQKRPRTLWSGLRRYNRRSYKNAGTGIEYQSDDANSIFDGFARHGSPPHAEFTGIIRQGDNAAFSQSLVLVCSRLTARNTLQMLEKFRVGFRHASRIPDSDARELQTGDRKRHRNAMVVVGLHHSPVKWRRHYLQTIIEFAHRRAQACEFCRKRMDAVALMMANEADFADTGWRGSKRSDCCERRDHVRHRVHRYVH